MNIEFRCPDCRRLLRVPEASAGKRAACPSCGSIATVPLQSVDDAAPTGAGIGDGQRNAPSGGLQPSAERHPLDQGGPPRAEPTNPYAAPQAFAETPASNTRHPPVIATATDVGQVISYAIEVWKNNLGILVGVFLFMTMVNWTLAFASGVVLGGIEQAGGQDAEITVGLLNIVSQLVLNALQFYLGIGATQISLRLARGEHAEFADLFRGGPLFLPAVGVWILFGLAVTAGTLLLIIPGLVVAILFWPVYFLVVDQKTRVFEAFSVAYDFAKINVGTTIVLFLASLAINVLGFLAFCIGLVFSMPLVSMMWVVGYLMMAGQLSTYRSTDQYAGYETARPPGG